MIFIVRKMRGLVKIMFARCRAWLIAIRLLERGCVWEFEKVRLGGGLGG